MYGYEEYSDVTPEQLLQKVSQEDIFKMVFKGDILLNSKIYINPLRKDDDLPGCWFEYYGEALLFMDFADKCCRHRSCFRMIMDKYNVDLGEALKIICNHFNLSHSYKDYQQTSLDKEQTYFGFSTKKSPTIITFTEKPIEKKNILYWSRFTILPEHLIEDDVHIVSRFNITNRGKTKVLTPYKDCYAFKFGDRVKLYQPFNPPDYKWVTNCIPNDIGNLNNISKKGKILVISKSYKDHRLLRNLFPGLDVIWFQNEGQVPSVEILLDLIDRFEDIVIFFDNDEPGIEAAHKIVNIFNNLKQNSARMVHLPIECKYKDPSDFYYREGREDLHKILKQINLYGTNT